LVRTEGFGIITRYLFFLPRSKSNKNSKVFSFNVACKWQRKILGLAPEEGWFILTNLENLEAAITAYKRGLILKKCARDFQSGGYNLENTNISGERLILILLIANCLYLATIQGQEIKRKAFKNMLVVLKNMGVLKGDIAVLYRLIWSKLGQFYRTLPEITHLMKLNRTNKSIINRV